MTSMTPLSRKPFPADHIVTSIGWIGAMAACVVPALAAGPSRVQAHDIRDVRCNERLLADGADRSSGDPIQRSKESARE